MSLNAKDKIVMRKRCNGGREGFEVFQRAVSTWAASRNPHLIRIMEGSAPFEGMSYKDTLGPVPKFEDILKKYPTGGGTSGPRGSESRIVKIERSETDEIENSKDQKTADVTPKPVKQKGSQDSAKDKEELQVYFDHWCRQLMSVIHVNITENVTQKIIERKVNVGDGQSAWNVIVLNALGTEHSHHLDVFFELLDLKCKNLKHVSKHNVKFNSMLDSIRTSLRMDKDEPIKDLPQSLKVGIYLKSLNNEFAWFRRNEVSQRSMDLQKTQERAATYAATEASVTATRKTQALIGFGDTDDPKKPTGKFKNMKCDNCGRKGHLSHKCFKNCKVCGKKDCHARKHKKKDGTSKKDISSLVAKTVDAAIKKLDVGLSAELKGTAMSLAAKVDARPKMDSGVNIGGCFPSSDAHKFRNKRQDDDESYVHTAAHTKHKVTQYGDIGPHKNVAIVGDGFKERLIGMHCDVEANGPILVTKNAMWRVKGKMPLGLIKEKVAVQEN